MLYKIRKNKGLLAIDRGATSYFSISIGLSSLHQILRYANVDTKVSGSIRIESCTEIVCPKQMLEKNYE